MLFQTLGNCVTHRTNIRHVTPFVDDVNRRWLVIWTVGNCVIQRANIRYVTPFVDTRWMVVGKGGTVLLTEQTSNTLHFSLTRGGWSFGQWGIVLLTEQTSDTLHLDFFIEMKCIVVWTVGSKCFRQNMTQQIILISLLKKQNKNKNTPETRMTASVLKQDPKTFFFFFNSKEHLFIRTRIHNLQIFGVIPFVKLQNDT